MTQSCEKCRVAAFAEVEVAVEAGGEVDDGVSPLELWFEGDAAGGDVDVDDDDMVPKNEVDTSLGCADSTDDGTGIVDVNSGTGELNEPVIFSILSWVY